jgi:hypothetical protein
MPIFISNLVCKNENGDRDSIPFDTPAMRATNETASHLTKPANNAGKVIGYQGERTLNIDGPVRPE